MKKILFLFLIVFSIKGYSQNKEKAFSKLKALYLTTTTGCRENTGNCSIFFNKSENALDVINVLIPLEKVEVRYRYSEMVKGVRHFVQFVCPPEKSCLFDGKRMEHLNSLSVPFYSKEACYNFIDAVANLKEFL